jgi:hypothetical protein
MVIDEDRQSKRGFAGDVNRHAIVARRDRQDDSCRCRQKTEEKGVGGRSGET